METTKIIVEADIRAEIQKVWKFYTHGEHIVNWNFASDDWCCPAANMELKAGGKYHARMEAKDGSFGFDFEAIIDDVIPFEKLSYTMLDDRKAEIMISKLKREHIFR